MTDSRACMHGHHMIPRHARYWSDLAVFKEHPMFQVSLTLEGHSCQHDILHKVWGDKFDHIAAQSLAGQITKSEAAIAAEKEGQRRGGEIVGRRLGPERARNGRWAEIREEAYKKTRRPITLIIDGEERHFESVRGAARELGCGTPKIYRLLKKCTNH